MAVSTLSKRLLKQFNRRQKQTTFAVIGALSVNKTIEKNETLYSFNLRLPTTVVPTKSDSDVIFVYTLTCGND